MVARISVALALTLALAGTANAQTVMGSISYPAGFEQSRTAVLEITLEDVTAGDAPAIVVATMRMPRPGSSPVMFSLPYDQGRVVPTGRYAVRASLIDGGKTVFSAAKPQLVLTQGRGSVAAVSLTKPEAQAETLAAAVPEAPKPIEIPKTAEAPTSSPAPKPETKKHVEQTRFNPPPPRVEPRAEVAPKPTPSPTPTPTPLATPAPAATPTPSPKPTPASADAPAPKVEAARIETPKPGPALKPTPTSKPEPPKVEAPKPTPSPTPVAIPEPKPSPTPKPEEPKVDAPKPTPTPKPEKPKPEPKVEAPKPTPTPKPASAPSGSPSSSVPAALAGAEWTVTEIDNRPVRPASKTHRRITLAFDAERGAFAGVSGCNEFTGRFEGGAGSLKLTLDRGLQICRADQRTERALRSTINDVRGFRTMGTTLELLDEKGKTLARLSSQTPEGR